MYFNLGVGYSWISSYPEKLQVAVLHWDGPGSVTCSSDHHQMHQSYGPSVPLGAPAARPTHTISVPANLNISVTAL